MPGVERRGVLGGEDFGAVGADLVERRPRVRPAAASVASGGADGPTTFGGGFFGRLTG